MEERSIPFFYIRNLIATTNAITIGRSFWDFLLNYVAWSFLSLRANVIRYTAEPMLKRNMYVDPIIMRSANVKYPVGGIPLSSDIWNAAAESNAVMPNAI